MANKAASIEDLMKKAAAAAPATVVPVSPAAPKPKVKTVKKEATQAEKLEEKMEQIRIANLEKIAQAEAAKFGLNFVNLVGFPIAPEALALVPRETANRLKLVCFFHIVEEIRFATTNPTPEVKAEVERIAKEQDAHGELYLVSETSFIAAEKIYDALPEIREVIYGYRIEQADLEKYAKEISNFKDLQAKITEVSTSDIVVLMIGASLTSNASDIHVEAEEEDVKIRFRIDGILQDAAKLPRDALKQIISRLKLLAGVKINVEDVPQDGRITIYLTNEKIDIRVSFLPTAFGESVVMRLLRPKAIALEFDSLGVRGKALQDLTREDPIEYKVQGINQSQIPHDKGYDFANGLRAILRQPPEVVMVGEIRDL